MAVGAVGWVGTVQSKSSYIPAASPQGAGGRTAVQGRFVRCGACAVCVRGPSVHRPCLNPVPRLSSAAADEEDAWSRRAPLWLRHL